MSKHEKGHEKKMTSKETSVDSEAVEISRAELDELKRKAAELDQAQERLLRSAADFENAKKRLAKEREEFVRFALEDIIFDLLPVLDNFKLALSHITGDDEKTKSMRDGFLLIQKQLVQVLSDRGLKPMDGLVGKPFDPHCHEAVISVLDSRKPEGTILEEIQTGYELNGKLLRPAKVKISTQQDKLEEKSEELT